ncbi:MAG: ribosome biogenesis GTPase Der [Phycisphaerales bacterium]|nr:ribosome biogenesis GTPase Der [Phycisphaerales bacterium]
MSFTVAIIGRPNVGKSTLFNRLISERRSIVDDLSGVTRDRQYGLCEWNGKTFNIIDTGGFVPDSKEFFESAIRRQVTIALEEAHAIVFMVDVTNGILHTDQEVARTLKKSKKPMFVTVNKVDNHSRLLDASEFYSLGFDVFYPISSINGSGTGELLDKITELIPLTDAEQEDITDAQNIPKMAIIGQPNVGKSSLLNALIGTERMIVSDIAGTTRDAVHTHYNLFKKDLILIDTAGIRKKNKDKNDLEFYSIIRAIKAIDEADVCLLMIDALNGITAQDVNLFSLIARKGKGIVLLVNKWDLVKKETNTAKVYEEQLKKKLAPFNDIPILFVSVLDKTRIFKALEMALTVYEHKTKRISTNQLNEILLPELDKYPAPSVRGHSIKIKYLTQVTAQVPAFAFFTNYPDDIKKPYRNFIENQLRLHFNFTGVPIRIFFKKK